MSKADGSAESSSRCHRGFSRQVRSGSFPRTRRARQISCLFLFMNIQQAYSDWSATYDLDRNLTRDLDQAVTKNTLASLHCKSVLELGCGTGKNTALLAEIGERICAIDFSRSMIERAKDKLRLD